MTALSFRIYKTTLAFVLALVSLQTKAQSYSAVSFKLALSDSSLRNASPNKNTAVLIPNPADAATQADSRSVADKKDEQQAIAPIITPAISRRTNKDMKKVMGYLKQLHVEDDLLQYQANRKLYYHLANVFAHLRLYPLAMKCFFKTIAYRNLDSKPEADTAVPDSVQAARANNNYEEGFLGLNSKDDSVINSQVLAAKQNRPNKKSRRISLQHILSTFNDGKTARSYALLFHVKQPAPGKRRIFVLSNTGHTFITLVKYNTDSTYKAASFGFYPDKEQFFSGTPLFPSSPSTFKDDAGHQWDEVLGKFISKRRFEKILLLTNQYHLQEYHLNNNNCTDFGLKAAAIAGINVDDTLGKWPLGSGNNPASAGQSILEGKLSNADSGKQDELLILKN